MTEFFQRKIVTKISNSSIKLCLLSNFFKHFISQHPLFWEAEDWISLNFPKIFSTVPYKPIPYKPSCVYLASPIRIQTCSTCSISLAAKNRRKSINKCSRPNVFITRDFPWGFSMPPVISNWTMYSAFQCFLFGISVA